MQGGGEAAAVLLFTCVVLVGCAEGVGTTSAPMQHRGQRGWSRACRGMSEGKWWCAAPDDAHT
eukprot:12921277-Prorocentrum_lima.AAC.1